MKCPKCKQYYLIVIRVSMVAGALHASVRALLRLRAPGEMGIRRALLSEPIRGMNADDIEFIATVARLLRGPGASPA